MTSSVTSRPDGDLADGPRVVPGVGAVFNRRRRLSVLVEAQAGVASASGQGRDDLGHLTNYGALLPPPKVGARLPAGGRTDRWLDAAGKAVPEDAGLQRGGVAAATSRHRRRSPRRFALIQVRLARGPLTLRPRSTGNSTNRTAPHVVNYPCCCPATAATIFRALSQVATLDATRRGASTGRSTLRCFRRCGPLTCLRVVAAGSGEIPVGGGSACRGQPNRPWRRNDRWLARSSSIGGLPADPHHRLTSSAAMRLTADRAR